MTPEGGVRQSQVLTLCDLDFSELLPLSGDEHTYLVVR